MRFVVLHHVDWEGRADHYDLLLEFREGDADDERALKAFASLEDRFLLIEAPALDRGSRFTADATRFVPARATEVLMQAMADHRRMYLHYEGAVSGGRGRVMRVDAGVLNWIDGPDGVGAQYTFELEGARLRGCFGLKRIQDSAAREFRLTAV